MQYNIWEGGTPLKCWEGKNVQNSARFRTTSDLIRNISGTYNAIDKPKTALSTTFPILRSTKFFFELWSLRS